VVARLTAPHEHKGKDCGHCKIDKGQLQKAYGLEGYNEGHLDQVIENIRRINRNLYASPGSIGRTNSRGKHSSVSSYKHLGSCHSGESAKDRLLGQYDKTRRICSTNHGPGNSTFSQRKCLDFVEFEVRPRSADRSYRDVSISAIDLGRSDKS